MSVSHGGVNNVNTRAPVTYIDHLPNVMGCRVILEYRVFNEKTK